MKPAVAVDRIKQQVVLAARQASTQHNNTDNNLFQYDTLSKQTILKWFEAERITKI